MIESRMNLWISLRKMDKRKKLKSPKNNLKSGNLQREIKMEKLENDTL